MNDRNKLLEEIEHLVRAPAGTLTGPEELGKLAGWDSLAMIEYIALVDEMFAVDVPAEQVRKCKQVQDLLNLAGQGVAQ